MFIIAAVLSMVSCVNEDGWQVKLPASVTRQWVEKLPDNSLYKLMGWDIRVWDFSSYKGRFYTCYYKSMEDAELIPMANLYQHEIYSYDCRYKDGIYTVTVVDEDNTRFFLSDITDKSMILTYDDGPVVYLTPLGFKITPVPLDF